MVIECSIATDSGNVRARNEDNFLIGKQTLTCKEGKFSTELLITTPMIMAVCDGMGGSGYGEEASMVAVDKLSSLWELFDRSVSDDVKVREQIETMILRVNKAVLQAKHKQSHIGTTIAMAILLKNKIGIANVGDSRIYQYKDHELSQISIDHNNYIDYCFLSHERNQYGNARGKNELTQYLGIDEEEFIIEPHITTFDYQEMNLLLCSDGLTSVISDEMIKYVLSDMKRTPKEMAEYLINQAIIQGSKDNITAMIIRMKSK